MPPNLNWKAVASADLLEIVAYIADDSPDAAQALKNEIEAKANALSLIHISEPTRPY